MKSGLRYHVCILMLVIPCSIACPGAAAGQDTTVASSGSRVAAEALVSASDDEPSAPPESGDMQSLFDGQTLDGWNGDERFWQVTDGVIRGETTAENKCVGNTFLIWKDELADFELRLSFRVSSVNNSGIQYRSEHITDPAKSPRNAHVLRGYQHEVRNSVEYPDVAGFIYDEGGKRKRICAAGEKAIWNDGQKHVQSILMPAEEFKKLFQVDQWNDVIILAQGNRIRHYLNGQLILDFTDSDDEALLQGRIGLQLHHGKPMWAEFRQIRMKVLQEMPTTKPLKSLK